MALAKIYANWKSICCFYILKNASNVACPTTWYGDIVCRPRGTYACVLKTFFSQFNNKSTRGEVYSFFKKGWFKQRRVDREIVKVCKYQDRVLLVLPIFSNVSQDKHKNVIPSDSYSEHLETSKMTLFAKNSQTLSAVYYFRKELHLRCLTESWMRLWLHYY